MIQVALTAVVVSFMAVWLKGIKTEYGLWLILAAGVWMGLALIQKMEPVVEQLKGLQSYLEHYGSYVKILIKVIGITYLTEFSANFCKDAGASMMASMVELFGKFGILILCMPIITALLETAEMFLGGIG